MAGIGGTAEANHAEASDNGSAQEALPPPSSRRWVWAPLLVVGLAVTLLVLTNMALAGTRVWRLVHEPAYFDGFRISVKRRDAAITYNVVAALSAPVVALVVGFDWMRIRTAPQQRFALMVLVVAAISAVAFVPLYFGTGL
jgi:hypothetical protein